MRKITYAGTAFYTGDALAEALLEYARALARHDIADTVFVLGRTTQGDVDQIEVLLGPASQMVDPDLVRRLGELTAQLAPRKPAAERFDEKTGRTAADGRPGFDDSF